MSESIGALSQSALEDALVKISELEGLGVKANRLIVSDVALSAFMQNVSIDTYTNSSQEITIRMMHDPTGITNDEVGKSRLEIKHRCIQVLLQKVFDHLAEPTNVN